MGTHPIFESDFDCLTVKTLPKVDSEEMAYIGAIASCSLKRKNDSTTRFTMKLLRTYSNRFRKSMGGHKDADMDSDKMLDNKTPRSSKLGDKIARAQKRLDRAKDQFSDELNKALNDETRLDELLDAVIMAEQDVMHHQRDVRRVTMISYFHQRTLSRSVSPNARRVCPVTGNTVDHAPTLCPDDSPSDFLRV